MKNTLKLFKIIALAVVIGLSITPYAEAGGRRDAAAVPNSESGFEIMPEKMNIQIDLASDEFLSLFDSFHEFDYREYRRRVHGVSYDGMADRIVIWTDTPYRDFQVIRVDNDYRDDRFYFVPDGIMYSVDELLPNKPFVINSYYGTGMMSYDGISFIDKNGTRRYFLLIQSNSDDGAPYFLHEF